MVLAKRRALKLTFANLSKDNLMCCTNTLFKTGKFDNEPNDVIQPGQKQTVFVRNSGGPKLAGVSAGVAMVVINQVIDKIYF